MMTVVPTTSETLQEWYARHANADDYAGRCAMVLLPGLAGKRVLDVNCRKGKGVYKFAEAVGSEGYVLGTAVLAQDVAKAREGILRATERAGLVTANMAFDRAFPEELQQVAEDGAFDLVYLNASINVVYDPFAVFVAAKQALAPQGKLLWYTVLAEVPVEAEVLEAARRAGDCVAAAPDAETVKAQLLRAGFTHVEILRHIPAAWLTGTQAASPAADLSGASSAPYEALITAY